MDIEGVSRLDAHHKMLKKKRMLREVFDEFHHLFKQLNLKFLNGHGLEIELGSGVSLMRDKYPEVLATDIVNAPHLDRVLNAEKMDLEDCSVRVLYGQNCFHHFLHPDKFFGELERVLVPGGGFIMLDPYHGPFAQFLFKRLFKTEGFDKKFPSWETPLCAPMHGANQALSYIVFERDRVKFEQKYPSLKIVHKQTLGNYLKYLLSGGLNFRQILPDKLTGTVSFLEKILTPFQSVLALHHVVVIQKLER
ncbi:methyltransferase domain-containing protein [Polynucleobacter sp. MG-27-Goln-C1]|nr:methyltransferase domain-containing protein [Polynucleobacter sp. MG-27-Goln-C1]